MFVFFQSSLINYWLGPFPRPFMRPGLFKSLKDFLVDVEMKIEEKNAIRAIFQSAAKAGSAHVPLAFATVDDFPEEIYVHYAQTNYCNCNSSMYCHVFIS